MEAIYEFVLMIGVYSILALIIIGLGGIYYLINYREFNNDTANNPMKLAEELEKYNREHGIQ